MIYLCSKYKTNIQTSTTFKLTTIHLKWAVFFSFGHSIEHKIMSMRKKKRKNLLNDLCPLRIAKSDYQRGDLKTDMEFSTFIVEREVQSSYLAIVVE